MLRGCLVLNFCHCRNVVRKFSHSVSGIIILNDALTRPFFFPLADSPFTLIYLAGEKDTPYYMIQKIFGNTSQFCSRDNAPPMR